MIDKAFLTSLAASLHVAGLRDQELSLASQPSLGAGESRWVEGVVKCATALDSYWSGGAEKLAITLESNFEPPPRFKDSKSIGHGGMGVVYSAFDQTTSETVAIKVAKSLGGNSESIKREFRTLAKIRHPNLVVLKELHQFKECVFFSMEFIRGERFNSNSVTQRIAGTPWLPDEIVNLCDRLLQLVDGVDFLHRSGFAHCDIKPSNILVTSRGRVVVLDLGLAQSLYRQRRRQPQCFGGTSAYMSPEQASGEPPQPASDWFAFGVVMFETLFGYRPFQGTGVDILFDKLAGNAIVPAPIKETGVALSLSKLCTSLLNPNPSQRPTVAEIRRCLKVFSSQPSVDIKSLSPQTPFFGREEELAILEDALVDSTNSSGPTLLLVAGTSGIGKTQLIQKFLENHRCSSDTIVLSGRCYENERIPYKAIDAVIGELATQWRLLESDFVSAELLNSISGVFNRFASPIGDSVSLDENSGIPRTAADGLHAVLTAFLSEKKRVIIFIDDIQWADADSGQLLSKVVAGIPLLLICSHRPMERPNQFLDHLTEDLYTTANANQSCRRINVRPFSNHDAEKFLDRNYPGLSKQVLGKAIGASDGVPMFLTSLAQQLCTMPSDQIESNTLNWTRDLGPKAKRLLELVCASGYPLHQSIAVAAAGISHDIEACVSDLSLRQLVTLSQSDGEVLLAPFHDMIREMTYAKLDTAEKKLAHSAIATVCENRQGVPPARLAFHFREAGEREKSCHYSILSGDVAASSQAFAESVRAYREALHGFVGSDEQKRDLKQKLASSLGRLGRAGDAGDLYMELASVQDGQSAHFLQAAAYQYCFAGRIEDAMQGFDRLLRPWGYTTFKSESSVLWRLGWLRFRLKLSEFLIATRVASKNWMCQTGSRPNRVSGSEIQKVPVTNSSELAASPRMGSRKKVDPAEAIRIARLSDLLLDTGVAISVFDPIQSVLFLSYSHLLAIKENDEVRVLRGNIWRAMHESMFGIPKVKLVNKILDSAERQVAKRTPYLVGLHLLARGLSACSIGKWQDSAEYCTKADEFLSANSPNAQWEIVAAQLFQIMGLRFTGQMKAAKRRYHQLLDSPANQESQLNISRLVIYVGVFIYLASDKPAEARAAVDEAIKMWPADKLCVQHMGADCVRAEIYLYNRDFDLAFKTIEKPWETLVNSNYYHFETVRIVLLELRGRCAVSRLPSGGRAAERIAKRAIRKLECEKASWAHPLAHRLRASLEITKLNFDAAKAALAAARDGFEQCNMKLFQSTAEAKLCEISGELQTDRFKAVQDWFESQEIKNPEAMVQMHYPVSKHEKVSR